MYPSNTIHTEAVSKYPIALFEPECITAKEKVVFQIELSPSLSLCCSVCVFCPEG